ncbi:LLM class flavin-dependent oxidoreductase [Lacicoccus alkaliphilus]|uniref:Luciferase family oxidoreductase, group 1 n=1 Tax=Lacicoccus alkaliphilus DSM 16010 TaxID=1123231 RepID=A0A1M7BQJ2_9BACL|nr:LLM class flavin-dependent oxidoreductase [Salinicoccus alkaliphilus]SHL57234.1 luciferase family oxidoreductase, group 1 [Salinicoccus alkaliphilus DSM 16010]
MPKRLNISALNLVPVRAGTDATQAIEDMVGLAKHIDASKYQRYWISEHHNMTSIASSATRILIKHILENTKNIRVGSGGVMLPNHSPLIVAEEFGTMHAIYGDRLDIGLGRAPGTDMATANAIRRSNHDGVFSFKSEIEELKRYLSTVPTHVTAYPGQGTEIPLYVLGSSTDSAHIAAELGLPYAFAAHFAPAKMENAFKIYDDNFRPSNQLEAPYKMASLNVIMADTNEEAEFIKTTHYLNILNLIRNTRGQLPKPVENMEEHWAPREEQAVKTQFPVAFSGDKKKAMEELRLFQNQFDVDEIMAVSYIYDMDALKKSYDLFEELVDEYNGE